VADSDPEAELEECLLKARPVIEAAGGRIAGPDVAPRRRVSEVVVALNGGAERPDPDRGVFSTLLVRDGEAVDLLAHLERLRDSVRELYGRELPLDLQARAAGAARPHDLARLRIAVEGEAVDVEAIQLPGPPASEPVRLAPAVLPGGLGSHKWRDRELLDELEGRLRAVALLVDLDGEVLEAAHANVWIVEGDRMVTPPLDGRILPGTTRARLLADPPASIAAAREEPIALERLAAADEVLLSSSLRGLHPAALAAGRALPAASILVPAS
jgi:para-aminobenzoate synthetase/4-amino-4-deoxychorismate lyase